MILFPGTKINLGLRITERRPDGFHNIETVFYPLPYGDILEAVPSRTFTFSSSGIPVPGEESDNLVVRAFQLMKKEYEVTPLSVFLHKVVPAGTGLGGGSADAAAMIRLVNQICSLDLPDEEMEQLASRLGADCAFFIRNKPAWAIGKGDLLTPLDIDLSNYRFALVIPEVSISTPEAYQQCRPEQPSVSLKEIANKPLEQWKKIMKNDFEALPLIPETIHRIKTTLYDSGAVYASMSGSGSAVYGIFREQHPLYFSDKVKVVWS